MKSEKESEGHISEDVSNQIYSDLEKEKVKNGNEDESKNYFNSITYIEYNLFNSSKSEIDFLFDYSKILGKENNDPKIFQWQVSNSHNLYINGIDMSFLEKRSKDNITKLYKLPNSYIIEKYKKTISSSDNITPLKKNNKDDVLLINKDKKSIENEISVNNNNIEMQDKNALEENNQSNINNDVEIKLDEILSPINNVNSNNKENNTNMNTFNENIYSHCIYEKDESLYSENNCMISNKNIKIDLKPGNYTEEEILKYVRKNNIKKKKKDKKEIKEKSQNSLNILSKKKKRNCEQKAINGVNDKKNKKKNISEINEDFSKDKLKEIFNKMKSEYELKLKTEHEKEYFLRKNLKIFEKIYNINENDLCSLLSEEFNITKDKAKMLMEYEIFKTGLENKYSNFSKSSNKLYKILKEYGIGEIISLKQLKGYIDCEPEIGKNLYHVMENIVNYRDKFNLYMGKHYNDLNKINEELKCFFPNIKEKNNEYITKLAIKINEYEEKFKVNISKGVFISYIKDNKNDIDCSEDLKTDLNNRRYSLESFINYNKGKEVMVYNEQNCEKKNKNNEDVNVIIENNINEDTINNENEKCNIMDENNDSKKKINSQIFNIYKNYLDNQRLEKMIKKSKPSFPYGLQLFVSQIKTSQNNLNKLTQTNNINFDNNINSKNKSL